MDFFSIQSKRLSPIRHLILTLDCSGKTGPSTSSDYRISMPSLSAVKVSWGQVSGDPVHADVTKGIKIARHLQQHRPADQPLKVARKKAIDNWRLRLACGSWHSTRPRGARNPITGLIEIKRKTRAVSRYRTDARMRDIC